MESHDFEDPLMNMQYIHTLTDWTVASMNESNKRTVLIQLSVGWISFSEAPIQLSAPLLQAILVRPFCFLFFRTSPHSIPFRAVSGCVSWPVLALSSPSLWTWYFMSGFEFSTVSYHILLTHPQNQTSNLHPLIVPTPIQWTFRWTWI